jgi:Trk K+ transport system NAD-binding subunit
MRYEAMKHSLWRTLRAQLRDARVLLRESRAALLLFAATVLGGAAVLRLAYTFPGTDQHPRFGEAVYATFNMVFFQTTLPFPEPWYLQVLFFVIPILGLAAIADGLIRFGGALANKQARGQKWQVAMASTFHNHVVVCGVGKVGYRVILELLKLGREVVAVERNPEGRFVEKVKALGVPILAADARRSETLVQASVERADAIIPCTDDELANLDIALDARELNPGIQVVMRMFDADLAQRVEKGFGLQTAFSTSALAAPIFAAATMRVDIRHSFYVGETLLNLSQLAVQSGSGLIGRTVERLESELDLSVVCLERGGTTDLHPKPDLVLTAGDRVLVLAGLETLQQLHGLNRIGAQTQAWEQV